MPDQETQTRTQTVKGDVGVAVKPHRVIGGVAAIRRPELLAAPTAPVHADFIYNGGPIIGNPIVYPTFWGSRWSDATHQAQAGRLLQFVRDLLASHWMNVLTQYGVGTGAGCGAVMPATFISSVPANLTDAQIHLTLQNAINAGSLPEPPPDNTAELIAIFLDESVAVDDTSLGIVMCEANGDNAFGYHYFFQTARGHECYYLVVPALDDACIRASCPSGGCSLNLTETQEQRRTQVFSHEFAELVTDPKFPSGWYGLSSDENGDICNGETATITIAGRTWNVQPTYSKTDDIRTNGASFCLASAPNPIPPLPGTPIRFAVALGGVASAACNADGRLELFGIGTDNAVWHIWQTAAHAGPWSAWSSLGGRVTGLPVVFDNSDGRLEVFARGLDGAVWHSWQTAPHAGPWSGWASLGGVITSDPAVAVNSDGRLEVFARGTDNALWHIWQTAPHAGPWSGWASLGGTITSDPAVALNSDGRLEVFARGTDDALWHIWQTAPHAGPWSSWASLGGSITSDPSVFDNSDGRLEVFARGTDSALWHIWQTAPHAGPWSGWASRGGSITSDPVVVDNSDGRLEVFARGTDDALWHIWQVAPHSGPWSSWASLGGIITSDPVAIDNSDGRLEVFARGTDAALWHLWQVAPHSGPWSGWASLGGILLVAASD